MAALSPEGIAKSFGTPQVLDGVHLDTEGEFLTLVGPSGCGKTILLRIVAGLDFADNGSVSIDQVRVDDLHWPVAGSWLGIPVSTVRATSHQVALKLGDSAKVPGSHEPPQYAVVLVDAEATVVHFHDFADESARFEL